MLWAHSDLGGHATQGDRACQISVVMSEVRYGEVRIYIGLGALDEPGGKGINR